MLVHMLVMSTEVCQHGVVLGIYDSNEKAEAQIEKCKRECPQRRYDIFQVVVNNPACPSTVEQMYPKRFFRGTN